MPARAIAKMKLRIDTAALPVKVYSALEAPPRVEFNLLHAECGTKLRQQFVCPADGAVVEKNDAARGYEYEPGQFVTFTKAEVDACGADSTGELRVDGFLGAFGHPNPLLYEHPYYLAPDQGCERLFSVLAATMHRSGFKAAGVWCLRGKEQPVVVSPHKSGLLLAMTRRFDAELRDPADTGFAPVETALEERQACLQIIKGMALRPATTPTYTDGHQARLRGLIASRQVLVPSVLAQLQHQVATMAEAQERAEDAGTKETATKRRKG